MILRDALAVRRVLRGTVALAEIDVDATALVGAGYPPGLVAGRSYLVMLRPGPETAVRLADPRGSFSLHERLDRAEIVAIVDLSQSADERASEAVPASRSGTREGVRFDPQRWAAARDAAQVGDEEAAIGRFIAAELLARPGATLAELRAWLGAPDVHQRGEDALLLRYWLARPRYERPEDGAVYGQVELHLRRDALVEGSVRWFRWRVSADGSSSSSELAAEGLRERGLATAVLQRREVSSTSAGR